MWAEAADAAGYARPYRLALDEDGRISAAALGLLRTRGGFSKMTFGTNGSFGIIGVDSDRMKALLAEVSRKCKPSILEVFGPHPLSVPSIVWSPAYSLHISLDRPLERIRGALEKRTRNALSHAERGGLKATVASDEEFDQGYDLIEKTARRKDFALPPRKYSEALHRSFQRNGLSEVILAKQDSAPLAAVHVIGSRGLASWWKGGALEVGYRTNATILAQWEAIKLSKERGFDTYDMGGTHPTDPAYRTIHSFKASFGGRLVQFAFGRRSTWRGRVASRVAAATRAR